MKKRLYLELEAFSVRTLKTERLILRNWNVLDVGDLFEYAHQPDVGHNAGWEPHETITDSFSALRSYMELGELWAVESIADQKVIGSIGIHRDTRRKALRAKMLGYALSRNYWGMGLATEAAFAAIEYAYTEMGVNLLTAYHYPENTRSARVLEKCGFRCQGILKSSSRSLRTTARDEVCYCLSADEWKCFMRDTTS